MKMRHLFKTMPFHVYCSAEFETCDPLTQISENLKGGSKIAGHVDNDI